MPEPIVSETGFVPGDGIETPSIESDVSPVIQQGRDIVGALFDRIGSLPPTQEDTEESGEATESQDSGQEAIASTTMTQGGEEQVSSGEQTPEVLTLTPQELERRIQAETDRRENTRRQRVERASKTAQNQQKLDRLRQAGDFEGYVAEHEAQKIDESTEAQKAQQELAARNAHQTELLLEVDSGVLDPIVLRLPENERNSLLEAVDTSGVAGRAKILTATVDRLIELAKAEGASNAEKALRNNAAFRKQILGEIRQREDEPDLIPSRNKVAAPQDMNTWVRQLIR